MSNFFRRTWCEIDLDAVEHNFFELKKILNPGVKIMSVVKADAYGHGVKYVAGRLQNLGTDFFAVSNVEEAVQLRKCGIEKPILVLGYTSANLMNIMQKYDVSQAILSNSHGESIVKFCKQNNIKVKVHFKMDTGMNRIGFLCKSSEEQNVSAAFVKDLCQRPQLIPEGIFTHFSSSDDIDDFAYTQIQFKNFMHTVEKLELLGVRFTLKHCCNSAAVINYPQMQLDMVRTGIMLYGLKPARRLLRNIDLVPAMSLKTVVSQIKCIPKKSSISYCRKYISEEKMTVATVPIGYADGYSWSFSNRASMLVGGKRAKILGNICMDQLVLDISDIKNVREGDIVTVFGADGEDVITVDELATYIDTINYEIICSVGKRVSRMYFSGAKLIAQINYIDTANGDKCCAK